MTHPLRLGVIGLGRRWRKRYQPALRALVGRFEVLALCDQVAQRAEEDAQQWQCTAVPSPTALLEREDIDAVLLADAQWFRLWPIEVACRFGKPVLCGVSPEVEEEHADALFQKVQESRLPVMLAMAPQLAPATTRLRELLATRLGPARVLICDILEVRRQGNESDPSTTGLLGSQGIAILDWCVSLLGAAPQSVLAVGVEADYLSLFLELEGGQALQIIRRRGTQARPRIRLQVSADQGTATLELPNGVRWTDGDGTHMDRMPTPRPSTQVLLERFYQALREGQAFEPDLSAGQRALSWLRAARLSRQEQRRVDVKG